MLLVKNTPANAGDIRERGSIPGSGSAPAEGTATHSSILAWRIPWIRGIWWATVHRVTKSQTQLKQLSMHIHTPVSDWIMCLLLPSALKQLGDTVCFCSGISSSFHIACHVVGTRYNLDERMKNGKANGHKKILAEEVWPQITSDAEGNWYLSHGLAERDAQSLSWAQTPGGS